MELFLPSVYSCFENGLCFDREKVELTPNEVQNTALQYAGWGPKGQQLVRESQTHLCHQKINSSINELSQN